MPIPSETDLTTDINQIKTYVSLYRNGYLPAEVMIVALLRLASVGGGGGGGTSDATAANQVLQTTRLTEIRDQAADDATAANQATEIARLVEIRDRLVVSGGRLQVQNLNAPITSSNETTPPISATSVVILAANANRKDAVIINNSNSDVFLTRGAIAVLNRGILLRANGGVYEINSTNLYQGTISAISNAATTLLVSEGV